MRRAVPLSAPLSAPRVALLVRLLVSLTVVCAAAGCRHSAGTRLPDPVPVVPIKVALEPGDVLEIQVFGEKDLSGKFQIADSGTIDYPLVGRVEVAGMKPADVASVLRKSLADGYLKKPHVAVFAEGYADKREIYVWGEVRKSGGFKHTSNMTLIRALTQAGGLTPLADKNRIVVTRLEQGKRKSFSLPMGDGQSASYRLEPGDVIFVPERVF